MPRVFVTGATGFLGSYITRLLVTGDYEVVALKRTTSSMNMVSDIASKVEWIERDLMDLMTMDDLFTGVDGIIHAGALVSFQPKERNQMMAVNVEATSDLINLALRKKVSRFVHISSIAALGRHKDPNQIIDESISWTDHPDNTMYGITKHLAEKEVWRGAAEGLSTIIINPSLILGAGQWDGGSPAIMKRMAKGNPFYPQGATGVVDVRDVAALTVKAYESDISQERFIASAENVSYRWICDTIAAAFDNKAPTIPLNGVLRLTLASADWWRAALTRGKRMATRENLRSSGRTAQYDNQKSIALLGATYRNVMNTIQESADLYKNSRHDGKDFGILEF